MVGYLEIIAIAFSLSGSWFVISKNVWGPRLTLSSHVFWFFFYLAAGHMPSAIVTVIKMGLAIWASIVWGKEA